MVYLHKVLSRSREGPNAPAATPQRDKPPTQTDPDLNVMTSLLADAGCTLCNAPAPPLLPTDPHTFQRHLETRFLAQPSLLPTFLSAFSSYIDTHENLRRVLISPYSDASLVRVLLLVAPLQLRLQYMLLEKLPEYFNLECTSLKDDVARLILNQFRWLDFLVDPQGFAGKLLEVLSICPLQLKKEIIGSLPEIIGDQSNEKVVAALEQMLQEDSEIIVPVLDSFSNLNQDDQLQEQVVTIALSCIRTVNSEHLPHVLRFLLLSATPINVRRIISQIREQLKLVGISDSRASRNRKLKGKSLADNTEASVLEALRTCLRFKNMLCEAILKELKCLNKAHDHKVIDVWLLMLIYTNGGCLQKIAEKIIKKKVVDGCFAEALFGQCIQGHRELVQDYFPSFLSVGESLLACKEQIAREFGIYIYTSLFEEFLDTYSRQEVLGSLVTHIGSGISYEVNSALECMILLTSKYSQELIPVSSYISGILDYLEGFNDEHLHKVSNLKYFWGCAMIIVQLTPSSASGNSYHVELPLKLTIFRGIFGNLISQQQQSWFAAKWVPLEWSHRYLSNCSAFSLQNSKGIGFSRDNDGDGVYEVFSHLALSARSNADSVGSSIANELLMIVRKQVGSPDLRYKKMGIIGTLKIVASLGYLNAGACLSSSQKSNSEEALELLKLSLGSCKSLPLAFILFYDELVTLLECTTLEPIIVEWMCKHVGEFESMFLCDLGGGKLPDKMNEYGGLEGELWMNLDGDLSPICLNILPLVSSLPQKSSSLQFLPAYFQLLSVVERLTNQGSLGGIDALLGCPLHLPSPKYFVGAAWANLTGMQKQIACLSLYYAINWNRELLNAFCTQVAGKVECITQTTRVETTTKLLKRLRNLVFLESLLNESLKLHPLFLPELNYFFSSKPDHFTHKEKKSNKRKVLEFTLPDGKKKCKKGSITSEKSDPNGKLRQPTILDTLKRAGVIINEQATDEASLMVSSKGRSSQDGEGPKFVFNEQELGRISAVPDVLNAQMFKFRPLHIDCLSILTFSESRESCCSDPAAELPLHLYLLRHFHYKLDYFKPPSKQLSASHSAIQKAPPGLCRITSIEFFNSIRPLFPSLKKHLDGAVCILKEGSDTCEDHWRVECTSAGNPDIPYSAVSKSSVAGSIFLEILCCYSKLLNLPDLCIPLNVPILKGLLEAFQPTEMPSNIFLGIQPLPSPGNLDYLYCGAYSFLESLLDMACSFSFSLASEILFTLGSLVSSIRLFTTMLLEGKGKNICAGFAQGILPFLCNKLGASAHKLLARDWGDHDHDKSWKSQGDAIQKILHIYLKNNESTLDLLDEFASKVLPQVPSYKTRTGEDSVQAFPTVCPAMLVIWYRVLHEENLTTLNKLIKEVVLLQKSRTDVQRETVERVLVKVRQSVNVVVSLVNMCRSHDKVAVHAMAVKYGGKFVDSFLKVFDFLKVHFNAHNGIIIQLVKELQKATRTIQALCSEAKGSKRTMITSKIPATKRSMERFLFHVKALLHNTSNGCSFWMGNLKHKDLFGQVVSSQVYASTDDGIQTEGDVEGPDGVSDQVCEETE